MTKTLRFLALALCLGAIPTAFAGTFGGIKNVSNNLNNGSQFPEIAYRDGVIHVVWEGYAPGGGGRPDVFYSRSTSALGTFSAPVNLSNAAAGGGHAERPQVTAAAGGVVVVAWNSNPNSGAIYAVRSSNSGQSFTSPAIIAGAEGGGYSRITDLFADSAARIHLAYYTSDDVANVGHVHHRMSCDSGASWPTDTAVTSQTLDGDFDNEQPRVGEAGGRMYLVFRSSRNGNPQGGFPPYSINMQSGTVSGCQVAWSYPARRIAGGANFSLSTMYRPDIYGDANGVVHLAWWDNTAGANVAYRNGILASAPLGAPMTITSLGVNHLEPGGITSTASTASGGYQSPPAIATSGSSGFLAYSTLASQAGGLERGQVLLQETSTTGASWGAPQAIATGNPGASPRLAIDNANTQNVGIVWTDVNDSGQAQVFYRLYTLGSLSGASLSFSVDPLAFGNRNIGTTQQLNVNLINTGTTATISGIAIVAAGGSLANASGDYQISGNTCGATLAAAASCTLTISFTPKAFGLRQAAVSVSSNDPASPTLLQLTGTGQNGGNFANNVSGVVTGYYETILRRAPDAGGLSFWSSEANRVVGLGASVKEVFFTMSTQFFNSPEYQNLGTSDAQYITDLYKTFFIRNPDGAGQAFWQSYLDGGMDRSSLLTNFLFSTEFSNFMTGLFGNPTVRPEIDMTMDLYRGILGTLPDNGGFSFWLGQIRQAQCQGASAVTAKVSELAGLFVNSPEYANRENARSPALRTKAHVGDLYNAFLRRGAEINGYNFWVSQITSGAQSRDAVRQQFLASPEFQARVNAVIAAGCAP